MTLAPVTPPEVEPLTADDVRARLGLNASVTDEQLDPMIKAARQEIDGDEGYLGRALITQTWDLFLDRFPSGEIDIPLPPLQSVASLKYFDVDGVSQTWDSANYVVVPGKVWRIIPAYGLCWPSIRHQPNAVGIRFVAGYGDEGNKVPEPIRQALAEKVSLARAMARPDPSLRSETTDGIDSYSYSTGQDFADALRSSIEQRLEGYRIWQ
jgi:uncharacterized phiE125 gp8 family phage protein